MTAAINIGLTGLTGLGWHTWLIATVMSYVLLCTSLRNRQRIAMQARFAQFSTDASLSKMTVSQAHAIQTWLAEQEFPLTFSAALFFALFKTYSIPSISRLLVSTGQFTHGAKARAPGSRRAALELEAVSRRAADTSILLTNMIVRPPGSVEAAEAMVRTNYLHARHRRAGRISNDDMLYTLSLFVLEPIRWTERFDWRALTSLERCAMATWFMAWGEDLDISYEPLGSTEHGAWDNGLAWLDALEAWSRGYECRASKRSNDNIVLVETLMRFIVCQVPGCLHGIVRETIALVLGPKAAEAMGLQPPRRWGESFLKAAVFVRKLVLRHLLPPRPYFLRRVYNAEKPDVKTGRYQIARWQVHPWYARTSSMDRWGPRAWLGWLSGSAKR
ncbi:hypothetical protein VMCG_10311 [Cytospora schulzeri]|uniref:ER-bound oxygenase mpaB/mpaB'/Rubber oxygenase catalytic domain-containing protein n=1 Tax=Cytospora schulzeri TaxID=448051 RepID=A0A423VCK2_9PEZI|nr:hypothetical protein VMCG_10311 [Valsa malicola]